MYDTAGCVDPGKRPAVRVKHGQGPKGSIAWSQVVMSKGTHDIHIRVAMGDHYSLGTCCCSASVVDRDEITFFDFRPREVGGSIGQDRLIVEPTLPAAFQSHKLLDPR